MLSFNYSLRNPGLIIIILWLKTVKMVCISLVLLGSLFHAFCIQDPGQGAAPTWDVAVLIAKGKEGS